MRLLTITNYLHTYLFIYASGTVQRGLQAQYSAAIKADWLVGCLTALQHRKVNLCQLRGGKPAQSVKYDQRDTMHITLNVTR